jgi:hypothetical protein
MSVSKTFEKKFYTREIKNLIPKNISIEAIKFFFLPEKIFFVFPKQK